VSLVHGVNLLITVTSSVCAAVVYLQRSLVMETIAAMMMMMMMMTTVILMTRNSRLGWRSSTGEECIQNVSTKNCGLTCPRRSDCLLYIIDNIIDLERQFIYVSWSHKCQFLVLNQLLVTIRLRASFPLLTSQLT